MSRYRGHYTVIRYIPNITREEFINVGVILTCPELSYQGIKTTTINQHRHAKCYDTDDNFVDDMVNNLKEAIEGRRLDEILGSDFASNNMLTRDNLEVLRGMYHNNIILSTLRAASVENPDTTLEILFSRYVAIVSNSRERERKIQ